MSFILEPYSGSLKITRISNISLQCLEELFSDMREQYYYMIELRNMLMTNPDSESLSHRIVIDMSPSDNWKNNENLYYIFYYISQTQYSIHREFFMIGYDQISLSYTIVNAITIDINSYYDIFRILLTKIPLCNTHLFYNRHIKRFSKPISK